MWFIVKYRNHMGQEIFQISKYWYSFMLYSLGSRQSKITTASVLWTWGTVFIKIISKCIIFNIYKGS